MQVTGKPKQEACAMKCHGSTALPQVTDEDEAPADDEAEEPDDEAEEPADQDGVEAVRAIA